MEAAGGVRGERGGLIVCSASAPTESSSERQEVDRNGPSCGEAQPSCHLVGGPGSGDFDIAGHRGKGTGAAVRCRVAAGRGRGSQCGRSATRRRRFPGFWHALQCTLQRPGGTDGKSRPGECSVHARRPRVQGSGAQTTITQNVQPVQVPQYGELELPADFVDYGTPGNMDLDAAINMLVGQNLDLMAAKLEIPMAEADVLTANLRANPIFYADQQLIPYGHFSFLRPGGPQQSDVNINYPLDISFKRAARTASAREAKSVTEAQLQDAVRNQIDNLYSVYEGVVSAGLTLKFSEVYLVGNKRLLTVTEELYQNGQIQESDLDAVKANLYKAQLQVRESTEGQDRCQSGARTRS